MKTSRYILLVLVFSLIACTKNEPLQQAISTTDILVKWNNAYLTETRENVQKGIDWYLSFLGATNVSTIENSGVEWVDDNKAIIRVNKLGLTDNAVEAFAKIIAKVKTSDEYQKNGCIDLGRWIMLTLNSSKHYYAITGVSKTFDQFKQKYSFRDSAFVTEESTVAKNNRLINLPATFGIGNSGFIINDGTGSIRNGAFVKHGNEVFDIMPNGQLRFAIYNELGELADASDTLYSDAGKPAKCLWCHEINIQIPHGATTDVPGFYSINTYKAIIAQNMQVLTMYRNQLKNGVDFSQRKAHTQTELLYISFMEPSAMRLANEWGISEQEVVQKLNQLPTHTHVEFPFLGTLYYRSDVEPYAPFKGLKTPQFSREPSTYEPNYNN